MVKLVLILVVINVLGRCIFWIIICLLELLKWKKVFNVSF